MRSGDPANPSRAALASPLHIFVVFLLWSLALTYPLILHSLSHIPLGDENTGTVPFFNLWTLQWNIDQLGQGYPNYWHAPIFAPTPGTFAFSETQPLSALLAAPIWLASQSPALAYNALVLLFLTLNGWFAFWLLRAWQNSLWPALLGGLLMHSIPFVAQEMGVLQLIAMFGLLWSLLFLSRVLRQPQQGWFIGRPGLGLALGTPVTFFTCSYYGLFSFFFLPLAFLFQLRREHFRLKILGQLLAIGLIAVALTAPFAWSQYQQLAVHGFTRSVKTIENNSARLRDYTKFLDYNILYGRLFGQKSKVGQRLFPGIGLVVLAGLGIGGRQGRRIKIYLLLATFLALGLSLGLRLDFSGLLPFSGGQVKPYHWLRETIPGLAQLRSPFRFAALVQMHLALLAGFGLQNLGRYLPVRSNQILALTASLVLFESLAIPLPLQAVPHLPNDVPWHAWLKQQGASPRIVLLPFAPGSKTTDFEQTTRWMLESHYFEAEMLNGYSGFFPKDYGNLRDQMRQFPTTEGIELLTGHGIDFVVVYHNSSSASSRKLVMNYLPLVYQDEHDQVRIYAVPKRCYVNSSTVPF